MNGKGQHDGFMFGGLKLKSNALPFIDQSTPGYVNFTETLYFTMLGSCKIGVCGLSLCWKSQNCTTKAYVFSSKILGRKDVQNLELIFLYAHHDTSNAKFFCDYP